MCWIHMAAPLTATVRAATRAVGAVHRCLRPACGRAPKLKACADVGQILGEVTAGGHCWALVRKGATEAVVEQLPLAEVAFRSAAQGDRVLLRLWRGAFGPAEREAGGKV